MFGISGEHLLILGIVLLIFGPRRLPELGNTLGKAIRNFKDSISGIEEAKFTKIDENAPKPPFTAGKSETTAQAEPHAAATPDHDGTSGTGGKKDPSSHS